MIVVISDIHDNIPNLKTALDHANSIKASALFVLGDLTNSETLQYLAENFTNTIYIIQGNCDLYEPNELKNYPQIINLGRQGGIIKIGQHTVGLCHEPFLIDALIKNRHPRVFSRHPRAGEDPVSTPSIIFYGHTHKPWEEIKSFPASSSPLLRGRAGGGLQKIKLINPGNLANTFYAPTFAIWDEATDKLELKIL